MSADAILETTASKNQDRKNATVLLADTQPISRESLRLLLESRGSVTVVGEAADVDAVLPLVLRLNPDILLVNTLMPGSRGMSLLQILAKADVRVRVILLTSALGKRELLQALQLGVRGIVLKSCSSARLFEAMQRVMDGEFWIEQEGGGRLMEAVSEFAQEIRTPKRSYGLTHREMEIIVAVVAGHSNPQIAEKFCLSEQTVKHHLTNIFDKLGVYSRLELAMFAVNHELITGAEW